MNFAEFRTYVHMSICCKMQAKLEISAYVHMRWYVCVYMKKHREKSSKLAAELQLTHVTRSGSILGNSN